jgi:uncharacterized membrane protein (DUF4010 family)
VDVDAITLSTARLAGTTISVQTAADVILIAVGVNMVTKVILALGAGRKEYGVALAQATAAAIVLGAIIYLTLRTFMPA